MVNEAGAGGERAHCTHTAGAARSERKGVLVVPQTRKGSSIGSRGGISTYVALRLAPKEPAPHTRKGAREPQGPSERPSTPVAELGEGHRRPETPVRR